MASRLHRGSDGEWTTMTSRQRETRTLSELAERKLREAIISGELPPGAPRRLQEQIERLEMSSVPIREALRYLERSGLVKRQPHRGTVVTEMSSDDLRDTYDLRMELESLAVRRAAERMTDEDQDRLEALLEEYTTTWQADSEITRHLHRELHMSIYAIAGSTWLERLVPMLWDNSERYRRFSIEYRTKADILEEHRRLVELCTARDSAGAVAALRDHLRKNIEGAIEAIREQERASLPN